jgi:PAS domain S-box-containing protein
MIVSFNEFLESTTGYSYSELIQKNWFDLFLLEKEIDPAKRYFRRFILGGKQSGKIVAKIITRNHKECFAEWHYQRFAGETTEEAVGFVSGFGQNICQIQENIPPLNCCEFSF